MIIPLAAPLHPVHLLRVSISRGFDSSKLESKGWEFSCPWNLIGSLPENVTQELLVGKLLVGGMGVYACYLC